MTNIAKRLSAYLRLMRFHKPVGILLLLWPVLWSLWIAGQGSPNWHLVVIFCAGVVIMRAAGCVINDIADRNFDKYVKRTLSRPLASGEITLKEALIIFVLLIFPALLLVLQLNFFTIVLAFIGLLLACLYPFSKRWTYWPQAVFSVTWSMGILMVFSAQFNKLPAVSWLIFIINILWSFMYDTAYGMADREDDLKIGVKSSAIGLGQYDTKVLSLLQVIIILLLLILGFLIKLSFYYFISIAISALLFIYQSYLVYQRNPERCLKAFLNNQWVGLIIFLGILAGFNTL